MGVQIVFSGIVNPTIPNLSERFKDAIGFFIAAPLLDTEVEIDVFLQIYLPNEKIRNIPLGKITEQAVLLNLTDTESVSIIPEEFQDTDLEMALLFLPSDSFTLEVFAITKDVTLSSINQQLEELKNKLDNGINGIDVIDFINVIDTVTDLAFIANLALPLFSLPSLPVAPGFNPTLPLLPGLP